MPNSVSLPLWGSAPQAQQRAIPIAPVLRCHVWLLSSGELRAGLVNAAVGVDVEMVVVVKLAVTSCGPVQINLRDAVMPQGDKFGRASLPSAAVLMIFAFA